VRLRHCLDVYLSVEVVPKLATRVGLQCKIEWRNSSCDAENALLRLPWLLSFPVAQKPPQLRTLSASSSVRRGIRVRRGLHGSTCCRYVRRGQTGTCRIVLTYDMRFKANGPQAFYKLCTETVGRRWVNTSHVKRKKTHACQEGYGRSHAQRHSDGPLGGVDEPGVVDQEVECRLAGVGGVV
jgi:hypothetical protein